MIHQWLYRASREHVTVCCRATVPGQAGRALRRARA